MAATEYTDQQEYAKFNQKKGCGEHGHPDDCGCKGPKDDDCGCCPAGLVSVPDNQGKPIACLTPNDAELYYKNIYICAPGYQKLVNNSTGEVIGCVATEDFAVQYALINPPA